MHKLRKVNAPSGARPYTKPSYRPSYIITQKYIKVNSFFNFLKINFLFIFSENKPKICSENGMPPLSEKCFAKHGKSSYNRN